MLANGDFAWARRGAAVALLVVGIIYLVFSIFPRVKECMFVFLQGQVIYQVIVILIL